MKPRMTQAEIALLARELAAARNVIEYGLGGSTLMAVNAGCRRIVSAETDRAWIDKALAQPELTQARSEGRLHIVHADIGEVGEWGMPVDETLRRSWLLYPTLPWNHVEAESIDMVLVDGRFRVASAFTSALLGHEALRILVHDLTTRPRYRPLFEFLDEVERVDSLGVFIRKDTATDTDLLRGINTCVTDYK
jgi:hypothetical protein